MKFTFIRAAAVVAAIGSLGISQTANANHHQKHAGLYDKCTWAASAQFGYAPSTFNEDLQFTTGLANTSGGTVTVPAGDSDITQGNLIKRTKKLKFGDYYEHPTRFGFDLGYFFMDRTEIFGGFDYYMMKGKKFRLFDQTLAGRRIEIEGKTKPNNRFGLFLGARHFFDVCSWYYPYLGFKVGVVTHAKRNNKNREKITYRVLNGATIDGKTQYTVNGLHAINGLYGGLQAGLDIPLVCLDPCLRHTSLFFAFEAVGSGAVEFDLPITRVNTTNGGFQLTHEVTQAPRTYMSYPMALGLKFRF